MTEVIDKKKLEDKIARARVSMLLDEPFWGHIAMKLETVMDESCKDSGGTPTMGTDGKKLYWHPEFVREADDDKLRFVIAHEVGHVVLMHPIRQQLREPVRWNFAADYADNEMIIQDNNFKIPDGALYDPAYAGKVTEWIYTHLDQDFDKDSPGILDYHPWQGQKQAEDGDGNVPSEVDQPITEQEIAEMVAQAATAAKLKGKLPGHLRELVDGVLNPKVNWKVYLQDGIVSTAKNDFTMYPPNKKHLWRGIYLPSITGTEITIAVYFDSSGSVSSEELQMYFSEVRGICNQFDEYTIYLRTIDTRIQDSWEIHPMDPMPNFANGRGGTNFIPAFEDAKKLEEISAIIYFTDGYGTFPDKAPEVPVFWCCTSDFEPFPFGTVLRIKEK